MGWWRRVEEALWTGKVVKDYGPILEDQQGIARRRVSLILADSKRGRRLFIRTSAHAWVSASVSFLDLDREAALKLRSVLDDALAQMS
jgi:hypothetical protein